jgi:3-dehydrosphinganine reductase
LAFIFILCHLTANSQKYRQTPNQVLKSYSFSINDASEAAAALEAASEPHGGRCPDAVFLCAGKSTPGFFVEEDETSLRNGMDNGYWVQAWSALVRSYLYTGSQ